NAEPPGEQTRPPGGNAGWQPSPTPPPRECSIAGDERRLSQAVALDCRRFQLRAMAKEAQPTPLEAWRAIELTDGKRNAIALGIFAGKRYGFFDPGGLSHPAGRLFVTYPARDFFPKGCYQLSIPLGHPRKELTETRKGSLTFSETRASSEIDLIAR